MSLWLVRRLARTMVIMPFLRIKKVTFAIDVGYLKHSSEKYQPTRNPTIGSWGIGNVRPQRLSQHDDGSIAPEKMSWTHATFPQVVGDLCRVGNCGRLFRKQKDSSYHSSTHVILERLFNQGNPIICMYFCVYFEIYTCIKSKVTYMQDGYKIDYPIPKKKRRLIL